MINLKLNGQRVELKGTEEIACSYSIAPIANISKRTSFSSVEFALPMTANNKAIIQNNHIIVNSSRLPFQFIPASLNVDGIDQKILSAQLVSTKDTIKLRLFGGNIDFYNIIKDLKLRDLDLSDLDHVWDLNLLAWRDLRFNTSGVIYPVIDFHADSPNAIVNDTDSEINARYMYPAIFRHTLITRIIEGAGFTLEGDFLSNADYLSTLIQTHTTNLTDEFKKYLNIEAESTKTLPIPASAPVNPTFPLASSNLYEQLVVLVQAGTSPCTSTFTASFAALEFDNVIFDPLLRLRTQRGINVNLSILNAGLFPIPLCPNPGVTFSPREGSIYIAKYTGDYTFELTIKYDIINRNQSVANGGLIVEIWKNNTFDSNVRIDPPADGYNEGEVSFDISLLKDDFVYFIIWGVGNFPTQFSQFTILPGTSIAITKAPEQYGYENETSLAVNLPDMTQSEFLLDTVVKFGLMLQVDNENKIVKFRQFSEIIANKPSAKDWSSKVDYSEKPEIKFDSEYAQVNDYKYSDDETVVKPAKTDYELVINNQLLKPRNTIFESKFAATQSVLRFGGKTINQIKLISFAGTDNQDEDSIRYRELILSKQDFVLNVVDGSASTTWSTEIPTTRFIQDGFDFNLGFGNLIPRFSSDIIELVQDFRTSIQLLRLNSLDINQLDFFIPVWIKRNNEPGAYYYISEISQFKYTDNESTEVELVKLP